MTANGKRIAEVRAFTPEISNKTARSKKCFPLTKLIKKWRRKHFLRLNFTKFSTQEPSIPHFSNTMLCDVATFQVFSCQLDSYPAFFIQQDFKNSESLFKNSSTKFIHDV